MTDDDLREAVDTFLARTDETLSEYDEGFTDADATLRVIRNHAEELRRAIEE